MPRKSRLVGRQPLNLRMRRDLQSQFIDSPRGRRVTVKDPVGLRYHSLRDDEWFVLQLLRSPIDLETIRREYQRRFAPRRVTLPQIQALLFRLHRSELVVSQSIGQAEPLAQRGDQRRRHQWIGLLQSALFIRFPGIDPQRLLDAVYPAVRWCLAPRMLVAMGFMWLFAAILFAAHHEAFVSELPTLQQFVQPKELFLLAVVLSMTKICHELGHAIACKHYGGECHEIGPMLLVFTPALYCDTSDSWMLPGRLQRAAVGAAGMAVELTLAAAATFLWWYTHPGIVHHAAMNVMLVCSISTLLFNGNPLLRYDGYYILSDMTDTPNLAQRSREILKQFAARWLLGIQPHPSLTLSRRATSWMLAYQFMSTLYRWTITLFILWFVIHFLKPYGLQSIGWVLCGFTVSTMFAFPAWRTIQILRTPGKRSTMRLRNIAFTLLLAFCLLGLTFIPVTHHVVADAQIVPHQPTPVYVTTSGFRSPHTSASTPRYGQLVQQGQPLLQLRNDALELQWLQAQQRVESQRLLLDQLRRTQAFETESAAQIPFAQAALDDLQQRVEKLSAQRASLLIAAPVDGVFVRSEPPAEPSTGNTLVKRTGLPVDAINAGSYLDTGIPLGTIATPHRYDAWLRVEQSDIEFVQLGQPVTIQLDAFSSRSIAGRVTEIAKQDESEFEESGQLKSGPLILGQGGASQGGAGGRGAGQGSADQTGAGQGRAGQPFESASRRYQVRVELAAEGLPLTYYEIGRGKILVDTHPLAQRLYRAAAALFRFQ